LELEFEISVAEFFGVHIERNELSDYMEPSSLLKKVLSSTLWRLFRYSLEGQRILLLSEGP